MNTTIHTSEAFRVRFTTLGAIANEACSTKWYASVADIPAKYMQCVGLAYDSESPSLRFDGVLEHRPAGPDAHTVMAERIQSHILSEFGIGSEVCVNEEGVAIMVGTLSGATTLLRKFMRHGCMMKAAKFNEFHLWLELASAKALAA